MVDAITGSLVGRAFIVGRFYVVEKAAYDRAAVWAATNIKRSSDDPRSVAHHVQAHPAVIAHGRHETDAIIGNGQRHFVFHRFERDRNVRGATVLNGIVRRLLRDAVKSNSGDRVVNDDSALASKLT